MFLKLTQHTHTHAYKPKANSIKSKAEFDLHHSSMADSQRARIRIRENDLMFTSTRIVRIFQYEFVEYKKVLKAFGLEI